MAWRLNQSVVRGELDNRTPGRMVGRLWLHNRPEPVKLDLKGNGYRDLAGCRLTFFNPQPRPGDHVDLEELQAGVVGDMTASRKVRILDVPIEEATRLAKEGKPFPEHKGNCLYLEWFSQRNGRVVIESTDFQISISEPVWTMTEEAEAEQLLSNQQALRDWLDRLTEGGEEEEVSEEEYEPDEDKPMDEFAWENLLKESDALTDKYSAALEKYKDHPDCEKLVAREMGWTWLEEALEAEERGALELEKTEAEDEELDPLVPNPLTEGVDWVRDDRGRIHHPLVGRATRVSMSMWHYCNEMDLLGEKGDEDVREMIFQTQTVSAKLAGALDHLAYDVGREGGFIVACLKRSLNYLHTAISAADRVAAKRKLDDKRLEEFRRSLFEIREQILHLMQRFRQQQW